MYTLYDIIISVAIGAIVLSMLIGFNVNIIQEGGSQMMKLIAQTNLTNFEEILEAPLRKIGYRVASPDSGIVFADSNQIKFKGDFDNNGTVDTLTYFLSPTAPTGNANTNTRMFLRTLNSQPAQKINVGVTRFKLVYFGASGTPFTAYPVPRPSQIRSIRLSVNVESTVPYSVLTEKYVKFNPGAYWEQTIRPKNLN